jgi:hypothetical protein
MCERKEKRSGRFSKYFDLQRGEGTMANNIKWKAIEHSGSKEKGQGKHVILVAYKSRGMGLNEIVGVAPLYDLRDANLDGYVSALEKFYASNWYDPYYVFELMTSASSTSCAIDAAIQMRDLEFRRKAMTGFLKTAYKICTKALVTIMVEKSISPGLELTLAETGLANLGKASDVVQFLVQTEIENIIIDSITK